MEDRGGASQLPDPSSSLVEMFEQIYAFGKIQLNESDAEDKAFKAAFARAQTEKAAYHCLGIMASGGLSLQFPKRVVAFMFIAPVSLMISAYMPHPAGDRLRSLYPSMSQKYSSAVTEYYEKVFLGPPLTPAKRSTEEVNADHAERSLRIARTSVAKRELR